MSGKNGNNGKGGNSEKNRNGNGHSQGRSQMNGMDNVQEAQKLYKNLRGKRVPAVLAALICAAVIGFGAWNGTQTGSRDGQQTSDRILQSQEEDQAGGGSSQSQGREQSGSQEIRYTFRTEEQLEDHFERHGVEMGFEDEEAYVAAANRVIASPDALHKLEAEDGDDVYYLEESNEFVVVSKKGYIRTYFEPDDGLAYYERQ